MNASSSQLMLSGRALSDTMGWGGEGHGSVFTSRKRALCHSVLDQVVLWSRYDILDQIVLWSRYDSSTRSFYGLDMTLSKIDSTATYGPFSLLSVNHGTKVKNVTRTFI